MEDLLRIGVVGVGHLGAIHVRLWKQQPAVKLVGVYDVDYERAHRIAREYQLSVFDSYSALLVAVDAVTIVTPTVTHYELARTALEYGKHCFIEKPVTSTYAEAQALVELAERRKLVIQVGHIERFNPALQILRQYSLHPVFVETHRLAPFKPRALDVSVVLDLMIHDLDILLWLMNAYPESIVANGVAVLTSRIDIANARLTFPNGAVANVTASRLSRKVMRKMRIFQAGAYFSVDFAHQQVEVYRLVDKTVAIDQQLATVLGSIAESNPQKTIVYERPVTPSTNPMQIEHQLFVDSIIKGAPPAVTAREAAEALRLAEEIETVIHQSTLYR